MKTAQDCIEQMRSVIGEITSDDTRHDLNQCLDDIEDAVRDASYALRALDNKLDVLKKHIDC